MNIYQILDQLNISYVKHDHPAVFTCEEAEKYTGDLEGSRNKNLFLRNQKGKQHYLVSLPSHKRADLKALGGLLNEKKLSFASPERLLKYLGLTPGSVSPFGLINDKERHVKYIIDKELLTKNEKVSFHPNNNTSTLIISVEDFRKYLEWWEGSVSVEKL